MNDQLLLPSFLDKASHQIRVGQLKNIFRIMLNKSEDEDNIYKHSYKHWKLMMWSISLLNLLIFRTNTNYKTCTHKQSLELPYFPIIQIHT